ncbi:hypothetical protein V5799_034480 [Amblyomma americanum]|uniref:F-box domain-containing protein n=1 Tax=Amblyomma americanum TaxID=6943 RepID=A0AAQ4DKC2_AMBAM
MSACEGSDASLGMPVHRDVSLMGSEVLAAALFEALRPPRKQKRRRALMSLPDDVLTIILSLLDWNCRVGMAFLCRRLKQLVDDGPWLKKARFTLNDPPNVFTTVMSLLRAEAITELDVSYYVLVGPTRLEEGIKLCRNLTVLRCVQTRLHAASLLVLLRDHLCRLEYLYWSALHINLGGFLPPALDQSHPRICKCSAFPATLRHMYVEIVPTPDCIAFVEIVVKHSHHLRCLHLHGHETHEKNSELACRILSCLRAATRDDFDEFTYTCSCPPNEEMLPPYPAEPAEDISADLSRSVQIYKQATLRWRSPRGLNCATLAELESMQHMKYHKQLTLLIAENGEGTISSLKKASKNWTCRHLEALTLMSLPQCEGMFTYKQNIRNQAALCNFIRSCIALTELNLSVFHFGEDFDCCSVIATGGIHNLRSLALASCALCCPRRLELLSRASFPLRELDVRGPEVPGDRSSQCYVCRLQTTCDDVSLTALRRLKHLNCLTLSGLCNARTLSFLVGCISLRDLRLKNMGVWHRARHQDMSPITDIWPQLRSLKLDCTWHAIDFSFMNELPRAPKLRRLCLTTVIRGETATSPLPKVLKHICPAVDIAHFHQWHAERKCYQDVFIPSSRLEGADRMNDKPGISCAKFVDYIWLCFCRNYIGATKPYGMR